MPFLSINGDLEEIEHLPVLKFISAGTNIMQKAKVYSTMMNITYVQSVHNYITSTLAKEDQGGVFVMLPQIEESDTNNFYKLFVSIKVKDVFHPEEHVHPEEPIKCEVVFVHKFKETTMLKTDFGQGSDFKITEIGFLRFFGDIGKSPNMLRELIHSDIRKEYTQSKLPAVEEDTSKVMNLDRRERDELCTNEHQIIETLHQLNIFVPSVVDIIVDLILLSVDYNVWDKDFLSLSEYTTDLYISGDDLVEAVAHPTKMKHCQELQTIEIVEEDEETLQSFSTNFLKTMKHQYVDHLFEMLHSLKSIHFGNESYIRIGPSQYMSHIRIL